MWERGSKRKFARRRERDNNEVFLTQFAIFWTASHESKMSPFSCVKNLIKVPSYIQYYLTDWPPFFPSMPLQHKKRDTDQGQKKLLRMEEILSPCAWKLIHLSRRERRKRSSRHGASVVLNLFGRRPVLRPTQSISWPIHSIVEANLGHAAVSP